MVRGYCEGVLTRRKGSVEVVVVVVLKVVPRATRSHSCDVLRQKLIVEIARVDRGLHSMRRWTYGIHHHQ